MMFIEIIIITNATCMLYPIYIAYSLLISLGFLPAAG